jgi:hypothetical protein
MPWSASVRTGIVGAPSIGSAGAIATIAAGVPPGSGAVGGAEGMTDGEATGVTGVWAAGDGAGMLG